MKFILLFIYGKMLNAIKSTTESFYMISGTDQSFYAPLNFIENHSKLVYSRITHLASKIKYSSGKMKAPFNMQQDQLKCTIAYKNVMLNNLFELFINILDDNLTGDFYQSFSEEIKLFILDYLETKDNLIHQNKNISDYTKEEVLKYLLDFNNKELKILYDSLLGKSEFNVCKLKNLISNMSLFKVMKSDTIFFEESRFNFNSIKAESIKKIYMRFMLPISNPNNGLKLDSILIDSFKSLLRSENKIINLFIDFHAEQFIYEYLSDKIEKKENPNINDCKNFLFQTYTDMRMVLETQNRGNISGKFEGSRVNLCFVRNDNELAFKHLNFALCYFKKNDDNALKDVCKNLNLIEEILPSYLYWILKGFRTEQKYFEIDIFIANSNKKFEKIQSDKCKIYDEREKYYDEDYQIIFD